MTRTIINLSIIGLLSVPALALNTACYNDLGSLTPSRSTEFQSVALCQHFCNEKNKPVYAVQGQECFCGDTLPPLSAKVENTECGGPNTYTIGSFTTSKSRRAIYATTTPETDKDTERETETNGILTAPDVDEGDSDPLASLSVNPTMVKTASNAPSTATGTILTAPSGTAYPNQPDVVASPSKTLTTSVATGSAKASVSASASASVSGGATPSASVVTGGAGSLISSGRGVVFGGLAGLAGIWGLF
ncbi:WSC domain protein [Aspergillus parasiticus SU-1]|uniref:WSC domain protein n=1 Tax=Aspergillus parasiticus (strain ATCC 56775 / NRRL 5862 / SRRC 143 / SU-1) TaxID=1403190 RepID=A0A0F0IM70_ASPPU|nr:WSC domain protein [Aspergillus parasiticus SU-1]